LLKPSKFLVTSRCKLLLLKVASTIVKRAIVHETNLDGRDAVERTWDKAGTNLSSHLRHLSSSRIRRCRQVPDHPGRYCRGSPPTRQLPCRSTVRLSHHSGLYQLMKICYSLIYAIRSVCLSLYLSVCVQPHPTSYDCIDLHEIFNNL